ncbi:MAG: hypothetical protein ARM1_0146 [Candidatus Micrarchaeota archaeon]|nr:MAG: hypothetical protein ARM1_0146 [Candidatus Micrarchaeota archaeon]
MVYFDIIFDIDDKAFDKISKLLGLSFYRLNKDIYLYNKAEPDNKSHIAFVDKPHQIKSLSKRGIRIFVINNPDSPRKIVKYALEEDALLFIPISNILDDKIVNTIKIARKYEVLYNYALKERVHVSIASFASSIDKLLSREQIISIARFIGYSEDYARYCLTEINREIIRKEIFI